jgi:microcystin-dependent protein
MNKVLDLVLNLAGIVLPFAGTTPPTGFLLCDGSIKDRAEYPALFSAIGTTFNTGGETETQFRVPDGRGRVLAGVDNMGGVAANRLTTAGGGVNGAALGATGGGETHTLTMAQIPAHSHGVTDPGHTHAGSFRLGASAGGFAFPYGGSADNASHSVTNIANTTGITIQDAGSGNAHPNVQPTLVVNYIIKT